MLELTIQELGDLTLFRCTGKMLAGSEAGLRAAVMERGNKRVVLDVAGVTGIDAAGLGTLVGLQSWAQAAGRQLKLMNVTPRVREILRITNLDAAFEVCSVPEMLELLCRAANPAFAAAAAANDAANLPHHPEAA